MNIEFLHTLIIEELRTLFDADSQLSEMLPLMERASLSPEVRRAINRRRELERDQTGRIVEITTRLESHPGGGQCHAMRGLLEEAEEILRRESGVYPARIEPRLLGIMRKVGHLRMASLKCASAIANLLEAREVEKTLEDCLTQEIDADSFIAKLGEDVLRLIVASSPEETATALDVLKQYA